MCTSRQVFPLVLKSFSHQKYRAPKNSIRGSDSESARGFVDGDFLEQFLQVGDDATARKVIEGNVALCVVDINTPAPAASPSSPVLSTASSPVKKETSGNNCNVSACFSADARINLKFCRF